MVLLEFDSRAPLMPGKTYERELSRLRVMHKVAEGLHVAGNLIHPLKAIAEFRETRFSRLVTGAAAVCDWRQSSRWTSIKLIGAKNGSSRLVNSLWENAPHVATLFLGDGEYEWRDVFGVPVMCDHSGHYAEWFVSPATADEIFTRVRAASRGWRITGEMKITPDARPSVGETSARVRRMIDRTRAFDTCRAWLLWGVPGAGKSVAARQIVDATCSSWVTVEGPAAASPEVWQCIETLRPEGIIIDDIDAAVSGEAVMLPALERAHEYARVIVSTANTPEVLRGAVTRPGRAADEDPVQINRLDEATARRIAPDVDSAHHDLPAAALAELQERARAGVLDVGDADAMRARVVATGRGGPTSA